MYTFIERLDNFMYKSTVSLKCEKIFSKLTQVCYCGLQSVDFFMELKMAQ